MANTITQNLPDTDVLNTLNQRQGWSGIAKLLGLLALMSVGLALFVGTRNYYRQTTPDYETRTCKRGDLVLTVTATGTLEPNNLVEIGCEISGRIQTVEVEVNDPVRAGDLLLTIDTEELEAQVKKSKATLAVRKSELVHAKATHSEAQANLMRMHNLKDVTAVSEQEIEAAKANLARAKANVASSEAQVLVADATLQGELSKLRKSRIYSPIDGIVLVRDVEPGQTVAATFQTPILLTICDDLKTMKLKVDIDEADVGQVQEGQQALFSVDAYPDKQFPARITSLHFASRRNQDIVTYEAILLVDNQDIELRPGMTALAEIVTAEIHDTLLAPSAALRFLPLESEDLQSLTADEPVVWILDGQQPRSIDVVTGRSDGRYTEILGGGVTEGTPLLVELRP